MTLFIRDIFQPFKIYLCIQSKRVMYPRLQTHNHESELNGIQQRFVTIAPDVFLKEICQDDISFAWYLIVKLDI